MSDDPADAAARVDRAVESLNLTIRDIRNFIFGLRPDLLEHADIHASLVGLADEFRLNTMIEVELDLDDDAAHTLDAEERLQILQITREALPNIARHSRATSVRIELREDVDGIRLHTQLIVNGTASQGEIVKAFGVPLTTVKRGCRLYRQRGASAFFKPPARRQEHRLTPEKLAEAQALLNEGKTVPAMSAQLGILASTLHKAIDAGRLKQSKKKILASPGSLA